MADVARLAGVSQSTVSLVLSAAEGARIAATTRSRVIQAANELGYTREPARQSPGSSKVVGLLIDELSPNWIAARLIDRLRDLCWESEADLLVASTRAQIGTEEAAIGHLLQHNPIGVFYASLFPRRVVLPKRLKGVHTVLLNCFEEEPQHHAVVPDFAAGAEIMLRHLYDLGHRKIGYLLHESWHFFTQQRINRISSFLAERGGALDSSVVRFLNGAPDDGYAATRGILESCHGVTALLCANDRMAYGALDAAKEMGLGIGRDLSICGYDDHEHARYTHPPLTTIKTPVSAMAREGLKHLLAQTPSNPGLTCLPGELVVRQSTGAPIADGA